MAPGPPMSRAGRVAARSEGGRPGPGEVGGEEARDVTGLFELAALPLATLDPTLPAGEADLPLGAFSTPVTDGIRFPINPLPSDTLR
jgi:hypothetical protein